MIVIELMSKDQRQDQEVGGTGRRNRQDQEAGSRGRRNRQEKGRRNRQEKETVVALHSRSHKISTIESSVVSCLDVGC